MNIAKIITGVQIVLIGLAVFLGVRALMVYFTPQSAWTPLAQAPIGQPAATSPAQSAATGAIDTSFDPFHRSASAAPPPANLGEDAPETTLDLTLKGKRTGENGTAILRTADGKQKLFRIGDEILPGVTLEAVNVEFIVISQEGRLERLTLEKDDEDGLRQTEKPPVTPAAQPPRQDELYSANPLLNSINFTPERVNNQVTGYKISPKQAGFDSALLGLQDGDILTSIGRISLQDEEVDLGAVLGRLQSRRSTTVELIRNGQEISVKVGTP